MDNNAITALLFILVFGFAFYLPIGFLLSF
jgi:hypothetical protein